MPLQLLKLREVSFRHWGLLRRPFLPPLRRHYGAERRRCDKWSSECGIRLYRTFIIDAVFLVIRTSLLHYAYEVQRRGLPAEDENVPASVWTSCMWNIVCVGGGLSTDMKGDVKISLSVSDWSFALSWLQLARTFRQLVISQKQIGSTSTTTTTTMFILDHTSEIITGKWCSWNNACGIGLRDTFTVYPPEVVPLYTCLTVNTGAAPGKPSKDHWGGTS